MKTWLDVKQVLLDTLPLFLATGKGVLNDEVPQTPRESCGALMMESSRPQGSHLGAFMEKGTAPGDCEDPPQARTMTTATENQPAIVRSHLISMNNGTTKQPQ